MAPFKIGLLNVLPEHNIKIPFIISDDMFYHPEIYNDEQTVTYSNLDDAFEYFKNSDVLKNYFDIPFPYYVPPMDFLVPLKLSELFNNLQLTEYSSETDIYVGDYLYGRLFNKKGSSQASTEFSYYRNTPSSTFLRFPRLDSDNYRTYGGFKIGGTLEFYISVIPEKYVTDGVFSFTDDVIDEQPNLAHATIKHLDLSLAYYERESTAYYRVAVGSPGFNVDYADPRQLNGKQIEIIEPPKVTNFYAEPIEYRANKGESVTPNFVITYDNGETISGYTNVIYDENKLFDEDISTLGSDGVTITISENDRVKRLNYTVRPNIPNTELFATFYIMVDDVYNPYYDQDPSGSGGGDGKYGDGENYFDTVGRIPNGSSEANDSRNGLYTRYLMTSGELGILGEYLWADELGLQVAKTLISLLYGDPVQTVISCVSYPFNLSSFTSSSSVSFFWGGHDSGLSFNALNQNSFSIDWGTIFISEFWGNFLDYSPHTQMQLYLPWGTGFVSIDPNDIMNAGFGLSGTGTLSVKTNIDLSRGMCVHNVIANNTVIGSYSGSCGRQIPITGSDYASKQVAMAGAAIGTMIAGAVSAGLGANAATSGQNIFGEAPSDINRRFMTERSLRADRFDSEFAAVGRQAIRPAIASAAALAVSPPSVSRSGSFQEGAGSLSIQEPYLIISRPKMSIPEGYGHYYGYPSNITSVLGNLTGYTEVGSIHIEGIPATSKEIEEIEMLLKGGVIL